MDITKCKGTNCPLREDCFRYTAKGDDSYQSYFVTPPYNKQTKECNLLWINTIKK